MFQSQSGTGDPDWADGPTCRLFMKSRREESSVLLPIHPFPRSPSHWFPRWGGLVISFAAIPATPAALTLSLRRNSSHLTLTSSPNRCLGNSFPRNLESPTRKISSSIYIYKKNRESEIPSPISNCFRSDESSDLPFPRFRTATEAEKRSPASETSTRSPSL